MPDRKSKGVSNLPVAIPDIPNAVSNIVLTGLGGGSATVAFSPNSYWPGNSYSVSSTPATVTQTITSSPATFTGLTDSTSYTFTITGTTGPITGPTTTTGAIIPTPLISQVSTTFDTFTTGTIGTAYVLS